MTLKHPAPRPGATRGPDRTALARLQLGDQARRSASRNRGKRSKSGRAKSTMLTTWPPGVGSSGPGYRLCTCSGGNSVNRRRPTMQQAICWACRNAPRPPCGCRSRCSPAAGCLEHGIVEREIVLGAQSRHVQIDVGGSHIERRRQRVAQLHLQAIERLAQRHFVGREIETRDLVVVEEASRDLRGPRKR